MEGCTQVTRCHCITLCGYMQSLQGNKERFCNKKWHTLLKQGCQTTEGLFVFFNHAGGAFAKIDLWEQILQGPEVDEGHCSVRRKGGMSWTGEYQGCALSCYRSTWTCVPWQPFQTLLCCITPHLRGQIVSAVNLYKPLSPCLKSELDWGVNRYHDIFPPTAIEINCFCHP